MQTSLCWVAVEIEYYVLTGRQSGTTLSVRDDCHTLHTLRSTHLGIENGFVRGDVHASYVVRRIGCVYELYPRIMFSELILDTGCVMSNDLIDFDILGTLCHQ